MADQVFYEIARWRLDEQLAQARELNSRLAGVFTAATALLVLFAAFQDFDANSVDSRVIGLLAAGAVVYALLVATTFVGYLERRLVLGPDLEELRSISVFDDEPLIRNWTAEEIVSAVLTNEPIMIAKRRMATIATALWALDVLLFAASVAAASL